MREGQDDTMDLAGVQTEERTIAAHVLIVYQSLRYEHFMHQKGNDWLFSFSTQKGHPDNGEIRETTELDPYAVRAAFDAVKDEKGAARFLSEAGKFWIWESVTWTQFREWQEYFNWLRLDQDEASKYPEGRKAWATAIGWENKFFKDTDLDFTHARFQRKLSPEMLRRNEKDDASRLRNLRKFALFPDDDQRLGGGRATNTWQEAESKFRVEGRMYAPVIHIEVWCVLEAIAATIYADRAHGLRKGKCIQCGLHFERESDHDQKYCPPPPWLKTSPCKNAFLQHMRRTAARVEKEAKQAALKLRREKAKRARKG
jgi:hypothetical protein